MKKITSMLGAFFFGTFITVGVIACADNDISGTPNQIIINSGEYAKINKIVRTSTGYNDEGILRTYREEAIISYDEYGRISNIYGSGEDASITYNDDSIVISDDQVPTPDNDSALDKTTIYIDNLNSYSVGAINNCILLNVM